MTKASALEEATIRQYCKTLHTPTIAAHFEAMAEQAIRDDLNRFNVADLAEHATEISFCGLKREISNEDFFCHPSSIRTWTWHRN